VATVAMQVSGHRAALPAFHMLPRSLPSARSADTVPPWTLQQGEGLLQSSRLNSNHFREAYTVLATGAMGFVIGFVPAASRGRQSRRSALRTRLYGKKKKKGKVPKALKSGYWQESDEEDELDIFEWFNAEDLLDEPPATVCNLQEVAAYTQFSDGSAPVRYNALEYRMPPKHYQLQKGIKDTHVVDQGVQRSFANTIREAVALHGDGASAFEGADVVTSADALRMLIAFVDGTMTEDMRSKGMNTKRRSDAALVDLCRISRIPEAPEAITLGKCITGSHRTGHPAQVPSIDDHMMCHSNVSQQEGDPSAGLHRSA